MSHVTYTIITDNNNESCHLQRLMQSNPVQQVQLVYITSDNACYFHHNLHVHTHKVVLRALQLLIIFDDKLILVCVTLLVLVTDDVLLEVTDL